MNDITQTILRSVLKIGAGYAIAKGLMSDSEAETVIASTVAIFGVIWGVRHRSSSPTPPQSKVSVLFMVGTLAAALAFGSGCHHTPTLQPGGAYAPAIVANGVTNATSAPEIGLYLADASYKLSYDLVFGALTFERDNRAELAVKLPTLKANLDKIRPVVWDIDQRWAIARQIYKANPTAAGLTTLQTILAEIARLVPVVQAELTLK